MRIQHFDSYEAMSQTAAQWVLEEIERKRDLLLCAATGNSPTGLYAYLAEAYKTQKQTFSQLRILKLDEWGGLSATHSGSCEYYLQKHVIEPLAISNDRYEGFQTKPENADEECKRVQSIIDSQTIDLCILGLGKNGHIGFNEPAQALKLHCHVAELSEASKHHGMVADMDEKPTYGMTLGIKDILSAKRILLIIYGSGKEEAIQTLLSEQLTTEFPVSMLWLHNHVDCLIVNQKH